RVDGRGAKELAQVAIAVEQVQGDHDGGCNAENPNRLAGQRGAPQADRRVAGERRQGKGVGAPDDGHASLQYDSHTYRDDDSPYYIAPGRADRKTLDGAGDQPHQGNGQENGEPERQARHRDKADRQHGSEDGEVALSRVDDARGVVNGYETDPDQPVDAARHQSAQRIL